MDNPIEVIQMAIAEGATPQQRQAGAATCRSILATLEPSAPKQEPALTPEMATRLAGMVAALRNVPTTQLLDVVIAKLRGALPQEAVTMRPDVCFRLPARPSVMSRAPDSASPSTQPNKNVPR